MLFESKDLRSTHSKKHTGLFAIVTALISTLSALAADARHGQISKCFFGALYMNIATEKKYVLETRWRVVLVSPVTKANQILLIVQI